MTPEELIERMKKDAEEGNNIQFSLFIFFTFYLYRFRTYSWDSHSTQEISWRCQKCTKCPKYKAPGAFYFQIENDWIHYHDTDKISTIIQRQDINARDFRKGFNLF